jgi:hypothetical protein
MAVDQAGNEILDEKARAFYDEIDRKVDEYMEALLRCLREVPTPKPHTLPPGTERMRYAPLEREILTAHSTLQRGWQRWKETRS